MRRGFAGESARSESPAEQRRVGTDEEGGFGAERRCARLSEDINLADM
jgi:hypothetical protein